MKIHILKENLFKSVALVNRFVTTKASLPVLSFAGIKASSEGVFFYGTDLELGVRVKVGGKVLGDGGVAVPAKLFHDLVQSLPLGPVEVEAKNNEVRVSAGSMKARLSGMSLEEFPVWETGRDDLQLMGDFQTSTWQRAWEHLSYAISSDEARPVLKGVLWELLRGRLVATDGYRLSVVDEEEFKSVAVKELEKVLLSGRLVRGAVRAFAEAGVERMQWWWDGGKNQVWVEAGDVLVMGRVLEGDFPHYEAIVPSGKGRVVVVEKERLMSAVKAAAIFARDNAHIVRFELGADSLTVKANTPQVGENRVEVEAEVKGVGDDKVAFNSRYLIDFLSRVESESVEMRMTESLKPVLFLTPENAVARHVIMPVRVREEAE